MSTNNKLPITRIRCWTRTRMPCPAALMLGRIEYDWVPKGETYGYGTVRLLGAGSLRSSGVEGLGPFREEEGERRAFARRALRPYLAAVGLGALAGYGQPQARAALGAGGIRPVEAFEDERQLILHDADACIRDRQRHATVFLLYPYRDAPALRRVLDRVVKENGSHLQNALPIEGGCNFVLVWNELDGYPAVSGGLGSLSRLLPNRTEVVTSYLHGCAFIPAG